MTKEMDNKHFLSKNSAVAGVIEALLLVALVSIVISTIQLVYIPQVMEQREAEHMDDISNQFSTLKSMIELQAITNSSAPISTMIMLGSRELPYFITARASGEIQVIEDDGSKIRILGNRGYYEYPLTSITYEAYNAYFVDQIYALEGGGIIVQQPNGKPVMRVDPSLAASNGLTLELTMKLPVIVGVPGKTDTADYGKCFVRTNWSSSSTESIMDVSWINITTRYPHAWNESLFGILGDTVLYEEGDSYTKISRNTTDINMKLTKYDIYVQIGHGWIK
jgi:hypothetical protein